MTLAEPDTEEVAEVELEPEPVEEAEELEVAELAALDVVEATEEDAAEEVA